MDSLRAGGAPQPAAIPEEASGIGVWVKPERPYPSIFVMMSLEGSNGIIETLNLGAIDEEGWQLLTSGLPREMARPINLLSFQVFEFVHGPSGTPGSVMIDNIVAALPDGEVVLKTSRARSTGRPSGCRCHPATGSKLCRSRTSPAARRSCTASARTPTSA